MKKWELTLLCFLIGGGMMVSSVRVGAQGFEAKVIYGEDNRKDLYDVQNSLYLELADSTVGLFRSSDVVIHPDNGTALLPSGTFGDEMGLCAGEPFFDQPSSAFCSGSLVGKDLLMTAGHCVTSQSNCDNTKFVFTFGIKEQGRMPTIVQAKEVYSCKQLIAREQVGTGADWALIRLDRAVDNHKPLEINRDGQIANGTDIVVIGHPSGLPTKVSDGAKVRSNAPNGYFIANLDTYGGNSGSAVFNTQTGKVEGILVRGERDFVYKNGCYLSKVCADDACRGEDVTKISALSHLIPQN